MRVAFLVLLGACVHEQQVVHLRQDAVPWRTGVTWQDRVDPARGDARVLRFEIAQPETQFSCGVTPRAASAMMTVFSNDGRELGHAACGEELTLRLDPGPVFVLARVTSQPADLWILAAP